MTPFAVFFVVIAAAALLVWLGLQMRPVSFRADARSAPAPPTEPIPAGLPLPVENYFRTVYGSDLPRIDSVLIKGRAVIRPFMNIPLPARFVFLHRTGRDYRHYFEATLFGLPVLRVNEGYIDGQSFFESPMGSLHDDPHINQGANLALWAEAVWFPSLWVTDSRVTWQAVDDHTAILRVPFGGKSESIVIRFDPQSHLLTTMEAMRYRDAGQANPKILWITRNEPGAFVPGTRLSASGSATWFDQGRRWAAFTVEELKYNLDVDEYIRRRGP